MINICEMYAIEFDIIFNPKKSKLLCFNTVSNIKPTVMLSGKTIVIVETELHLGNRLYSNIYTKNSHEMVANFYRRSNNVISNFRMCDSITLNNLHSSYCTSFYGIELYNFSEDYMNDIYVAWRKCIRRIFKIPNTSHNFIVSKLNYCIINRLDSRLTKFIYNMLHSNNIVVQSIVKSKLLLCPRSIISENYKYLSYKYKLCHLDWHNTLSHLLKKINVPPDKTELSIANIINELCKVRDGVYQCDIINDFHQLQIIIDYITTN